MPAAPLPDFPVVLAAAQAGDEDAFTRLYRAVHPVLQDYLHSCAPEVASDVAAETWYRVARELSLFAGDEQRFQAWVFTIAHGRLVDEHLVIRRRPEATASTVRGKEVVLRVMPVVPADPGGVGAETADPGPQPGEDRALVSFRAHPPGRTHSWTRAALLDRLVTGKVAATALAGSLVLTGVAATVTGSIPDPARLLGPGAPPTAEREGPDVGSVVDSVVFDLGATGPDQTSGTPAPVATSQAAQPQPHPAITRQVTKPTAPPGKPDSPSAPRASPDKNRKPTPPPIVVSSPTPVVVTPAPTVEPTPAEPDLLPGG